MTKFYLLETLVQVLWSLTPSASHYLLRYWPVEFYVALRFTLSGLMFLAIAYWHNPHARVTRRDLPVLMVLGCVTYGVSSLCALYGLRLGGVVTFSLASGANALIVSLLAVVVLREGWNRRLPLAIALSLAGSILLAMGKYRISTSEIAFGSMLLVWGAYLSEGMGFVFSKRFTRRYPLPLYLGILQLSAGTLMWGVATAAGHAAPAMHGLPVMVWLSLLFIVFVSCGFCYAAHYWLLQYIDGHRLAFFESVHAMSSVAFGVILFAESLNPLMLAGGALLLASVWMVNR